MAGAVYADVRQGERNEGGVRLIVGEVKYGRERVK